MVGRLRILRAALAVFTAIALVTLLVPSTYPTALAASVEPQLIEGNPTCEDVGDGGTQFKIENSTDLDGKDTGQYTDGRLVVDLEIYETEMGWAFDWSTNIDVCAVLAKGGPRANLYRYLPAADGDTLMHSPLNSSSGTWYGLSHISFCYDGEPTTTTTVEPTTTTTVEPTTTIEDEVLGTQLTTSTTMVTDVSGSDALPYTGVSGVGLGILGLSLIGAGVSALAITRTQGAGLE